MRKRILLVSVCSLLLVAAYMAGTRTATVAHASTVTQGVVPKSYGRLVTAIADQIGTGLIFEGSDGTIRFVSVTGMKEGELARYDTTPTHGGIPKSYGRLVTAFADSIGTGLVFEDGEGVVRFVSVTGMKEGELARYDKTPTHGGIPKSYGHLVSAVVNHGTIGLVFEGTDGVIRFVTITGVMEQELKRN